MVLALVLLATAFTLPGFFTGAFLAAAFFWLGPFPAAHAGDLPATASSVSKTAPTRILFKRPKSNLTAGKAP